MRTNLDPVELAQSLARRSQCRVQVGAVLSDRHGVFSWGWNSSGEDGNGLCAERHAIGRANKNRLKGCTLTIASRRARNGRQLTSIPCEKCAEWIRNFHIGQTVYYLKETNSWITLGWGV